MKALARKAHINSRSRDKERADALQKRADDAARRAAEKLEKRRQLDAYHHTEPPPDRVGVSSYPTLAQRKDTP